MVKSESLLHLQVDPTILSGMVLLKALQRRFIKVEKHAPSTVSSQNISKGSSLPSWLGFHLAVAKR
jgi:hypothetical protein